MNSIFYLYSKSIGLDGFDTKLFGGGSDGSFYAEQAIKFAENSSYKYTSVHIPILGIILKIFGTDNLFVLKLFNQMGNILLVLATIYLSTLITGKIKYNNLCLIILINIIYPSLLILSTTSIYRDTWILFYYILGLCFLIKYIKSKNIIYNFLFIVTLVPLFLYREYAILPLLTIYIFYFLRKFISLKWMLFSLFILLNLAIIFAKDYKFPLINMSISDALLFRQTGMEAMTGGSQLNIHLDTTNLISFYINYFYAFISSVFGPLIWQANSFSSLMLMCCEGIPFLFIAYYIIKNIKKMSVSEIIIIISSLVLFLEISLINDNLGTATRVRILGWLPLIVMIISRLGEKKNENSV
ncbi:hypothetical protein NGC67_06310 [Mammaliicoccus fleurettii]|uniref:hypothetical protein n=1 Tax=Mammaliicoccus fleurettii TaxID=150056 RepID=UPI002DBF01B9|nr:hypothetical protein [Mammaliicoccus fleurettii]MEB7806288.1 hypothetical protein [Mammaliicoccus fleurettii]